MNQDNANEECIFRLSFAFKISLLPVPSFCAFYLKVVLLEQ